MADRTRVPVKGYPGIYKVQRVKGTVYEARYRVKADGKRQVRGKTFLTLAEANAFLKATRQDVATGAYVAPEKGRVTFGTVATAWLADKDLKPRTLDGYQTIIDTWLKRWEDEPVGGIGYSELQSLLTDMKGKKPQTIRNVFNIVRAVLDQAADAGYIRENPYERFRKKIPTAKKGTRFTARFLTAQQVAQVAAALEPPHDLLVTLAAWSGLRRGEIAGLRVRRVDTDRHRVDVQETVINLDGERRADTPKSEKSRRSVPIPPPVAAMLRDHIDAHGLGPDDYVFGNLDGSAMNMPAFCRTEYRKATEAAGVAGLRFHDLRHTYASLMAHHGEDIHRVSKWMGHSTIAITADLYTHLFEDEDTALGDRLTAAFATSQKASDNVVPFPVAGWGQAGSAG